MGSWDELHRERMSVGEMNWLSTPPGVGERVSVQIRHRAPAADAEVVGLGADEVEVRFRDPQRAAAPGQSAVVFAGDRVLGGGRIAA